LPVSAAPLDRLAEPDLPPPQAPNNNAHPSARITVRRTLNIKRFPLYFPRLRLEARRRLRGESVLMSALYPTQRPGDRPRHETRIFEIFMNG
jgi:hypothetical protein